MQMFEKNCDLLLQSYTVSLLAILHRFSAAQTIAWQLEWLCPYVSGSVSQTC